MANEKLFGRASTRVGAVPAANTRNQAGGKAYALDAEAALAQLAATGTFNDTFYGDASRQLEAIKQAADAVSPLFLAQTAIYARRKGAMKDMPAALTVMLCKADAALARAVFPQVVNDGKMLRSFVLMTSSGVFGRKTLSGSLPKKLVARWLESRSAEALLRASVGSSPTLAQIIRLAHPKPADADRRALYGYFLHHEVAKPGDRLYERIEVEQDGRKRALVAVRYDASRLPEVVRRFEAFKRGETTEVPDVDFRLLDSAPLGRDGWAAIARNARFLWTIKNLNTCARHGVFEVPGLVETITARIRDPEQIRASRVFPYQIQAAWANTGAEVPASVREALQEALEIATENVAPYGVPVAVVVDVSGSMSSPITGHRPGATSSVRCVDVAGLIAATVLRRNPGSFVVPVDTRVHSTESIDPRGTILANAARLAKFGGGGTNLSLALAHLNQIRAKVGAVLIVSDSESWADRHAGQGTGTLHQFRSLEARCPGAKLVCLNLQPGVTTQAPSEPSKVLNLGGFSDATFGVIGRFLRGRAPKESPVGSASEWLAEIKAVDPFAGAAASVESSEPRAGDATDGDDLAGTGPD